MNAGISIVAVPRQLLRGERRPRVVLVGRLRTGKSSLFLAASSASPQHRKLLRDGDVYDECLVDVGLEQMSLVDLPPIESLHTLGAHDRVLVKYLLWGDRWPAVAAHEAEQPALAFRSPDVLIQVVDATALQRDLELTLELCENGRKKRCSISKRRVCDGPMCIYHRHLHLIMTESMMWQKYLPSTQNHLVLKYIIAGASWCLKVMMSAINGMVRSKAKIVRRITTVTF